MIIILRDRCARVTSSRWEAWPVTSQVEGFETWCGRVEESHQNRQRRAPLSILIWEYMQNRRDAARSIRSVNSKRNPHQQRTLFIYVYLKRHTDSFRTDNRWEHQLSNWVNSNTVTCARVTTGRICTLFCLWLGGGIIKGILSDPLAQTRMASLLLKLKAHVRSYHIRSIVN